eukprot:15943898-Heterocapsa_arctica.AAC.1
MAGGQQGHRAVQVTTEGSRDTQDSIGLGAANRHAAPVGTGGSQRDETQGPKVGREARQGHQGGHDCKGRSSSLASGKRICSVKIGQAVNGDQGPDGEPEGRTDRHGRGNGPPEEDESHPSRA